MSAKECCRTCQHCVLHQASPAAWCRLRRLTVHGDVALYAFCHHWTKRPPSLPKLEKKLVDCSMDTQLEFNRALVSNDI